MKKQQNQQQQQQQPKITFTNNRQKPTNHGHCNFKINYYEHVPFFDWTYRRYTNFFLQQYCQGDQNGVYVLR